MLKIGDIVVISDNSPLYKHQGRVKGKKLKGRVVRYLDFQKDGFLYVVRWANWEELGYNDIDLECVSFRAYSKEL